VAVAAAVGDGAGRLTVGEGANVTAGGATVAGSAAGTMVGSLAEMPPPPDTGWAAAASGLGDTMAVAADGATGVARPPQLANRVMATNIRIQNRLSLFIIICSLSRRKMALF
jgi:hypothetical protein